PPVLWERYVQLTQIEAAFKTLKSDLGLRPIYHHVERRVEAHIFVAFLSYALSVTLRQRLTALAPGLTPRAVLEKLATIQMLDVCFPTTDGRWLIMPRYTQPEPEQSLLLHRLHLSLPPQPPPRIKVPEREPTAAVGLKM
ncbi:MAG: IS1634 family transposase, partial [Terriglobia bacterium]